MMDTENINQHPWRRASLWLLFLGPFFFLSYGFANWFAEHQTTVGSIVFDWEYHIPFIAWTILPYWVIDALYGISLFICPNKKELDTHAKRLLTAQVIAIICFVMFPMGFTFVRPETSGFFGMMFDTLNGFDKPFNQAPSLHIALVVILWVIYVKHLPRVLVWPFHILSVSIAISVLTTYQHHFIDIPTGLLLGWFCVWLWPDKGESPLLLKKQTLSRQRRRIALYYFGGSVLFATVGFWVGDTALWLLWPAVSLLFVASNYAFIGIAGFQKDQNGEISLAAKWILFPYLLGAKINSRLWTHNNPKDIHVVDGVWLGRFPSKQNIIQNAYRSVVDLTAEFHAVDPGVNWHAIPSLDLIPLQQQDLILASRTIEQERTKGPVLVSCALGYSRSVMTIIFWLTVTNRADDLNAAIAFVRQARPAMVLKDDVRLVLAEAIDQHKSAVQTDG